MALINSLGTSLQKASHDAFTERPFADPEPIQAELIELDQWITLVTGLQPLPGNRILAALRQYRADRRFSSILHARHVCHGCLVLYDQRLPLLMEDAQAFPMLLQYVDRFHHRPRLFRRCFQGLMSAYFAYEPGIPNPSAGPYHNREVGWRNRQMLREFLQRRQSCIQAENFNPDWVNAIAEHPDIFSPNPSQAYVSAALQNDFTAFENVCERLNIGTSSWFARGLVYEQVDKIVEKPDTEFKQHINISINLLNRHRWSVDKGLAKIINRYAVSDETETNSRLRDFSVSQWKNPWLAEQAQGWKPVSTEARKMVSVWIKQHLVRQFFWILAQGTPFDVRRAEFWMQYHHRIDALYFALGSHASNNATRDFIEIRRAMEGHLLGLDRAGAPDNNACILMMGNHAIVEFGDNHTPAYIYDRRTQLPFELKRGFKVTGAELRNQRAAAFVQMLEHRDTRENRWEAIFEAALIRLNIRKRN
ncbi:EH signature domain-containing protein [Oxalobacter vibrioformis]|uniref:EH signature domain-containing protein n=1 Tax=Oxalobacter vibrioformis TaxID=933080 RepID=A0A9E9LY12_9BURK|nr:EH signature domain-containing protein [Oxalobacter vibrioformis]WAW10391.1 EH signature domain-containing protein [Oxalobacter vibrioformis]